MFIRTTAINKMLALTKRVKGIQGGTSAGKTFGILPILIDMVAREPLEISVVAESVPHLKRGAFKDFQKIMVAINRWHLVTWNKTDKKCVFPNGGYIEFFSADDDSKLRGARRDVLYMNECNNMTFKAYTELASRTKKEVFLDWNPTNSFWFHKELMNDEDVDFLIVNYKDNEGCPQSAIDFIEKAQAKAKTSKYWENWYNVYGLGMIGNLEGVVFNNWETIDTLPPEAKYLGSGMDFGFTNDPSTLVDVYRYNGCILLDEIIYRTGLLNRDLIKLIKQDGKDRYIIADSAEPKSIQEIRVGGVRIKGATKGRDSIMHGISLIQEHDILVTKRSANIINELQNYQWQTDKEGETINKPSDSFNHSIDAIRYICSEVLKKNTSKVFIG